VLKKIIPLIALGAMLLSPSLASARIGSGVSVSTNVPTVGVRVTQPRIHSTVKVMNCHKYERRNPYNDTVVIRTVCS